MIGVAFKTRLTAVSATAIVAAFLLFPRLWTSLPLCSCCSFSSSLRTGYTSIPFRISSPRIKKTFSAPAEATAANGTKRVRIVFVAGDTLLKRGTIPFKPSATEHEAETARTYDWTIVAVERGVDLLALALLIATLRDWFAICHSKVPVVWET